MRTAIRAAVRRRATERRRGSGAASILMVAAVALTAALGAAALRLGTVAVDRARLTASADLVALAAVTGGDPAARDVAHLNGVAVVAVDRRDGTVVVEVAGTGGTARSAARPAAAWRPGGSATRQHGG